MFTKLYKSYFTYKAERSPYDPEPIPLYSPCAYAVATRSMYPGDGLEIPNRCNIREARKGG